jgi:hypothetical protein
MDSITVGLVSVVWMPHGPETRRQRVIEVIARSLLTNKGNGGVGQE